ncbi:MAG: hypothetical protein Q8K68_06970 [Nitrospirota bacterium]|nr:hypothetical protein [Nitrospirota bacterium]
MVKVGDTYFAQGGGGNEQNYEMARAFARAHPGTPAYFVEDRISALGGLERTVRGLILDPASAQGAGMVVPYVSEGGLPLPVPPIPHPDNYEPVPPTL